MKTKADKIQEEAFRRFGIERTMKGVSFRMVNPAAVVGVALIAGIIVMGAMIFTQSKREKPTFTYDQSQY